ncbi:MAG: hypothetical protein OES53_07985 [Xanthomonadales bacterium]|nr:hypothetical protein [Xanthomonadales bacterium]MDH3940429.1 hypothetical protein [Xanthomonadales bacterium]MDH4001465.1 hypothetical protein [Xanthomonadales bacterium]
MTEALSHHGKFLHPHRVFTVFKWMVYILLAWNAVQFFQEDLAASAETFGNTITWRNLVEAYSATIDTAAWVVLLLIFEFETAIIPDDKLKGRLNWFLLTVKSLCYFFIVYAFYGYISKYLVITDLASFSMADVCSLVGTDWNYVASLDDYPPIDTAACATLQGQDLLQVSGTEIIGTREALDSAWGLAVIDIINAGTWLVIVALLQLEVMLQLGDRLTDRMLSIAKYLKGILYLILFLAAAYWGVEGTFLDFWDAFLWLVAFIFIELNIFQWHEEVEEEKEPAGVAAGQGSS